MRLLACAAVVCAALMLSGHARAETVYQHNTLNQLTQVNQDNSAIVTYQYDANGNMTGKTAFTPPTGGNLARQLFQWIPSYGGTSAAELARGGMNMSTTAVAGEIRDASSGVWVKTLWFTADYAPISLAVVPNYADTSAPELVMMQRRASDGATCGDVKDASSDTRIRRVWFHAEYPPLDIEAMESIGGTSAPELVSLGRRPSDGATAAEAKDGSSGLLVKRTYFHAGFPPVDIEIAPNFADTSAPELVSLGQRLSTSQVAAEVIDASSSVLVKRVFFDGAYWPLDIEVMSDFADTSAPELVMLGWRMSDGAVTGEVRDASTGTLINAVSFDSSFSPVDMEVVSDFGGTSVSELVVLGYRVSDGAVAGEVRDASSGVLISTVSFDSSYIPQGIEVLPTFGGTSAPELAALGVNPGTGAVMAEVRDASTGALLSTVSFNPDYVVP
jgi:YD repeat-containing protein